MRFLLMGKSSTPRLNRPLLNYSVSCCACTCSTFTAKQQKQPYEYLGRRAGSPDNPVPETRNLITYSRPVTHPRMRERKQAKADFTSHFVLTLSTIPTPRNFASSFGSKYSEVKWVLWLQLLVEKSMTSRTDLGIFFFIISSA